MRNQNRFVLTVALAAALVFPVACATTHTTSSTSTDNGTVTNTSSTTVAPAIPTTSNTTTTTTPMASGTTAQLNTTTDANTTSVTNADGSVTTTTRNADGSVTTVTRNSTGNLMSTSSTTPASTNSTTTTVTTGNPATTGTTKITTTTTTTTYAQPGMVNGTPATATATVTTAPAAPMTSSTQTDIGMSPFGFGHSRNHGRSVDLNLFADWANFNNGANGGGGLPGTIATGNLGTNFRNANGYGLSVNAFFAPTLSVEFGASRISPSATFTPAVAGLGNFTGTRVRMTPITGTLQWHFLANHSFDPYIGLGGAYVMFNSRSNITNAGTTGFQSVNFTDRGGPLANAGVSLGFGRSFGLLFDAKYIRLRGNGTTNFGNGVTGPTNATFDLNPLILSAGVRFGF